MNMKIQNSLIIDRALVLLMMGQMTHDLLFLICLWCITDVSVLLFLLLSVFTCC